jgi:restriction system protein
MDLSHIINQATTALLFLIPLVLVATVVQSSWFKGVLGEFVINLSTNLMLDKDRYHLIKNVTLPTDTGTTQIDHIIVSEYGVFVVETKNMKGWIFGGQHQKNWTQKIFKHTNKFQNPLHQNYKHLKVLEQLLGLQESQLHSVVVFIGDSTFKTEMPENVTYGGGYLRYIKSQTEPVLATEDVTNIIDQIESGRFPRSFTTHRQHTKHVRTIIQEKEKDTADTVTCPRCDGAMVLRTAKKGSSAGQAFWGCEKFPTCRGIVKTS